MIRSLVAILAFSVALLSASPDDPRTIKFDLHGNVVFVKASIGNSESLDMVLDSGTIRTTPDEMVALKLGLDLSMKARSSGANGTQEISVI